MTRYLEVYETQPRWHLAIFYYILLYNNFYSSVNSPSFFYTYFITPTALKWLVPNSTDQRIRSGLTPIYFSEGNLEGIDVKNVFPGDKSNCQLGAINSFQRTVWFLSILAAAGFCVLRSGTYALAAEVTMDRNGWKDLINWHWDPFLGFKFSLDGLVHFFGCQAWDPCLTALRAYWDINIFKKIQVSLNQTIKGGFLSLEFSATNGTQRMFHGFLSLRVLGSSHLLGSSQWTVII